MADEFGCDDDTWTALLDLPELLACDGQLDHLLSIVDDSDTGLAQPTEPPRDHASTEAGCSADKMASTKPPIPRRRRRTHQERQKDEIVVLRRQVVQMNQLLEAMRERTRDGSGPVTLWERAARVESKERWLAARDNTELRTAVHAQATFIEHLQRLISNTASPRNNLHAEDPDAWQVYRLPSHASIRVPAIHAIADRQLRRMQNAFIQLGVYGATQNLFKAHVLKPRGPSNSFQFELVNHVSLPAPYMVVAAAVWQVYAGESAPAWPNGTTEAVEVIDGSTVYSQFKLNGVPRRSNTIRKRYQFQDRDVIVSRSVLQDARDPQFHEGAVENKWSWLQVAACPGTTSCWLTYVVQMDMGDVPRLMVTDDEVAGLEAMLQQHPGSSEGTTAPARSSPFPDGPHMRSFVDRGKRFVQALHAAVNHAIAQYSRGISLA